MHVVLLSQLVLNCLSLRKAIFLSPPFFDLNVALFFGDDSLYLAVVCRDIAFCGVTVLRPQNGPPKRFYCYRFGAFPDNGQSSRRRRD